MMTTITVMNTFTPRCANAGANTVNITIPIRKTASVDTNIAMNIITNMKNAIASMNTNIRIIMPKSAVAGIITETPIRILLLLKRYR